MELRSGSSWIASTRTMLHPIAPSPSGFAEFKEVKRDFEDLPRTGCPSTITTDQNIEAVERIIVPDRQITVRRVA